MAALTAVAQTGAEFLQGEAGTKNKRVSSNGKWLVGENRGEQHQWGLDQIYGYVSFVQNLETGEKTWLTSWDENDYSKLGQFVDVSNDGLIAGTAKDLNSMLTVEEWGSTNTLPLNSAAVWTTDGTCKLLGTGTYKVSDFEVFNDGSYATAISADGTTVAGYVSVGNYAEVHPVRWTLNETTGEYTYEAYAVPEDCHEAMVNDLSADGKTAVGYVKIDYRFYACWWPEPGDCRVMNVDGSNGQQGSEAFAVSDNGVYIALTLDGREPMMYEVGLDSYRSLGAKDRVESVEIGGITDERDVFGTYHFQDGCVRPFWYYTGWAMMMDFDYFIYRFADDIDAPYEFDCWSGEELSFSGVSADGKVIAGNDDFGAPWTLTVPGLGIIDIPYSDIALTATFTDLGSVEINFKRVSERYMYYEAKEYVIYRDGKEVDRVAVADLDAEGKDEVTVTDTGVSSGTHYYSAAINYTNTADGSELLSPKVGEQSIYMDSSFEFPLYDNFDTGSISSQGWYVQRDYGETEYQSWGCPQYFGFKGSNYLHSGSIHSEPYSFSLVSRHLDARDKESVYISFARKWQYANSRDWELDGDTLSLEVSSDGTEWTVVKDFHMYEIIDDRWSFEYFDLTPWAAGKVFQVRLRMHGQGKAQYAWSFENLTVDEKPQHESVKGLMGFTDTDGNYRLTWKNSLDAYPLTYQQNPYDNAVQLAIGNDGKELITVNKFDAADLAPYKGKYLTSISTEIDQYESSYTTPTRVAVVVYEDGKLIREQEITSIEFNADITVMLDEPVLIDGTKELMFGLKLLEHAPDQYPIAYLNTKQCVYGKSDLYSDDGGVTWKSLADFFATVEGQETDGYACWRLTGNVTDEADVPAGNIDTNQFAYEVYKNGQKYSDRFIYLLQAGYTDTESVTGDSYEVRTFYYDGTVSEISEAVTNSGTTGIGNVVTTAGEDGFTVEDGKLNIGDGATRATLYSVDGVKLYEGTARSIDIARYGRDIYVLTVYGADGTSETHKFVY